MSSRASMMRATPLAVLLTRADAEVRTHGSSAETVLAGQIEAGIRQGWHEHVIRDLDHILQIVAYHAQAKRP